jgi:hypothetical protein
MTDKTKTEILAGTRVTITEKDGTTTDAIFVSTKAGWTNVTVKGEARKVRAKDAAAKTTKKDLEKAERALAKAAKDKEKADARAAAGEEGDEPRLVPADLSKYVLHETKTASGRRHIDVDDDTAAKLRELALPAIYKYAAKVLDESVASLTEKYQHLNPGMQRMNLGNRVRKAFRIAAEVQEGVKAVKAAA